jgi:hypothetical protein
VGAVETLWNTPSHPASDDRLAMALLSLANGTIVRLVRTDPQTIGDRLGKAADVGAPYAPLAQEMAGTLADFISNPSKVVESFLMSDSIGVIHQCRTSLVIGLGAKGITRGIHVDFPTLQVAMYYALSVVLDTSLSYGRSLCRCRLKSCGKFYFAKKNPKGGGLNLQYCTPAHRQEANDAKSKRAPTLKPVSSKRKENA